MCRLRPLGEMIYYAELQNFASECHYRTVRFDRNNIMNWSRKVTKSSGKSKSQNKSRKETQNLGNSQKVGN